LNLACVVFPSPTRWVRQRILAGTAFASYNDTVSHLTDEGMT
jgi:hypothetical protein